MAKYWYVIRTAEVIEKNATQYIGTSTLSLEEIAKALGKKEGILIDDLVLVSLGGEIKKYSEEWEPHPDKILLNPRHITSLLPLKEGWQEFRGSWEDSLLSRVEDFFKGIKGFQW